MPPLSGIRPMAEKLWMNLADFAATTMSQAIAMFAPALSPQYDLTKALKHVKGKLYVFSSPHDFVVLSAGTKMFGTMDGVRCEAAGLKGFVKPTSADSEQYKKLVPQPYQRTWAMKCRPLAMKRSSNPWSRPPG